MKNSRNHNNNELSLKKNFNDGFGLSRMMENFFNPFPFSDFIMPDYFMANRSNVKSNIRETEDGYMIEIAAPGLSKEDVKVDLYGDELTVSYEATSENAENDGKGYVSKEWSSQSFSRSFIVPEGTKAEDIKATCKNGVLRVSFPAEKQAELPHHNIDIDE